MKTVLGHGVSRDRRLPKDKRGVDLISEALPFGRLWYGDPNAVGNAVGYATFFSRSHDAVIRVYDEAGNVIETHEHTRASSRSGELCQAAWAVSGALGPKENLPSCSVLTQIASMRQEIDCKMPSNYS
jgi:hypothetical protein